MYHSHQGCFVCIRSSKSPKNVTLTPGKAQRALKIIAINSGGFMKYLAYKSQAFSNIKLQTWSYSPWTYSVKFPIFYNTNFYAYWYIKNHCTAWHKSESLYVLTFFRNWTCTYSSQKIYEWLIYLGCQIFNWNAKGLEVNFSAHSCGENRYKIKRKYLPTCNHVSFHTVVRGMKCAQSLKISDFKLIVWIGLKEIKIIWQTNSNI